MRITNTRRLNESKHDPLAKSLHRGARLAYDRGRSGVEAITRAQSHRHQTRRIARAVQNPIGAKSAEGSPSTRRREARTSAGLRPERLQRGRLQRAALDYRRPERRSVPDDSHRQANSIYLLRDANKDGKIDNATERFTFATGLNRPFGMAIHKEGAQTYFYVGNTDSVVRFKYQVGQTKVEGPPEKLIELPIGGHWTRDVLFSRDGKKMYVAVGSGSNVNEGEPPIRAAINEYNPDGTQHRIFAEGIRNPVGLAWNPANCQLWTAVNERDLLGDDLVPEYATSVKDGGFYGWPDSYIGKTLDPRVKNPRMNLVERAIIPDVLIEPHAAALGIEFYTGKMFPKEYVGDAFVALHGSWNRSKRSGYKVIRIPFEKGKPEGGYENFLTGWVPDESGQEVWGRPVGVRMIRDGSLLVVDDGGKKVWRVTYKGKK